MSYPPGLECLIQVDQLFMKKQKEPLEILTSFDTDFNYKVLNSVGQPIYYSAEFSDYCVRLMCGASRSFNMTIIDNNGQEVMHLERPFRCDSCLCPCYLLEMTVCAPSGEVIGRVKQLCNPLRPKFVVLDQMANEVLYISGPLCECCVSLNFKVLALDGKTEVGRVSRKWTDLSTNIVSAGREVLGITFPLDLDVHVKATLLASAFFIDFMYLNQRFT